MVIRTLLITFHDDFVSFLLFRRGERTHSDSLERHSVTLEFVILNNILSLSLNVVCFALLFFSVLLYWTNKYNTFTLKQFGESHFSSHRKK